MSEQSDELARDVARKKKELERLERELARKKATSGDTKPHVTYILSDEKDKMIPWLVEIAGEYIRVGAHDGRSAAFEFKAKDKEQRREQFLAWAKTQDRSTHYFVLLIKPSGVESAIKLEPDLKIQRFEIGSDLLPEAWVPFE